MTSATRIRRANDLRERCPVCSGSVRLGRGDRFNRHTLDFGSPEAPRVRVCPGSGARMGDPVQPHVRFRELTPA